MTNFNDFEAVLAAANAELNNLKAKSKEVQTQIDAIDQDRYEKVYDYFNNLVQLVQRNNLDFHSLVIPTSIPMNDSKYYAIRINQGWDYKTVNSYHDTRVYFPEIAVCYSDYNDDYYNGDNSQYGWLRWLDLPATYKEACRSAKGRNEFSLNLMDFLTDLVEHFDEYEPEISANFKEAVTRQMAHNLKSAEIEIRRNVNVLINK